MSEPYRRFDTGATRDTAEGKLDVEGFESALVRLRFARYMHRKRFLADGTVRAGDNWQQGLPVEESMKSLQRHALDLALHHDGFGDQAVESYEDTLCALIFNASSILFEHLKAHRSAGPRKAVKRKSNVPHVCPACMSHRPERLKNRP